MSTSTARADDTGQPIGTSASRRNRRTGFGIHLIRRATTSWHRLLFPPRCTGCLGYLGEDTLACERCQHAIFTIHSPLCRICGDPRQPHAHQGYAGVDEICGHCLLRRPRYVQARALWEYSGSIADAIQQAKYGGRLWILRSLAAEMAPWFTEQLQAIAEAHNEVACTPKSFVENSNIIFTTIPMHPRDLRARGYNLAHLLFRQILKQAQYPSKIAHALQKTRRVPAQAGLGWAQRQINLRKAFECRPRADVKNRVIVLFDDVLTTGATADEAARALRRGGAAQVYVLTAARAVSA